MLPKRSYYDSSIFDEEVRLLFATGYQFVAMTTELQNDRDFVCIDHHGASIVVQNFKGEIRAFQNICTHRFNRIQSETRGNRPLMCTYHGWSFDKNGAPAGMPKREEFAEFDNAQLCLPQYPVETCGKFVFINRGGGASSLREHLGEFYQMLEEMSGYFGPDVNFCDVPNAANWKLLVENVMECYHCYTAHGETFIPWGVGKLPMEDARFDRGHSSAYYPRLDKPREELRQRYLSHLASRKFNHNSFFHIYIFPNLFISSSQGLSFYVGHLLPTAVDGTIQRGSPLRAERGAVAQASRAAGPHQRGFRARRHAANRRGQGDSREDPAQHRHRRSSGRPGNL
jgi:phenylpropionate dioxygenase-like ring-hydroxylating dioxygenase large terminal subunit